MGAIIASERDERRRIFRRLTAYFGKTLPSSFFQKTRETIPDVERIHPIIRGIYKPAWSQYVLAIASILESPYADQIYYNPDHSWSLFYQPRDASLDAADNAALRRCMAEHQPILVLRQVSDKHHTQGARHRLLGLGWVESYDETERLFRIRGLRFEETQTYLETELSDDLLPTALRLEALEEWQPFLQEDRVLYRVSPSRRDQAFRKVVLENYDNTCAATDQQFVLGDLVEADAAHIIPKEVNGTDDPRNGLALSKSVHWAFDAGVFTISDQYEILIHPKAHSARHRSFRLLEMDRRPIRLPSDPTLRPHGEALEWHRRERYGRFALP